VISIETVQHVFLSQWFLALKIHIGLFLNSLLLILAFISSTTRFKIRPSLPLKFKFVRLFKQLPTVTAYAETGWSFLSIIITEIYRCTCIYKNVCDYLPRNCRVEQI